MKKNSFILIGICFVFLIFIHFYTKKCEKEIFEKINEETKIETQENEEEKEKSVSIPEEETSIFSNQEPLLN